jgi:hypothetical protein
MKELYILLVELANGEIQTKVNKLFDDGYQLRDSANFKYENGEVHIVQSFVLSERGIYREIEELVRSEVIDYDVKINDISLNATDRIEMNSKLHNFIKNFTQTYYERCTSLTHNIKSEPFARFYRDLKTEDYLDAYINAKS